MAVLGSALSALSALQGMRNAGLSYVRISSITGISASSIRRYIIGEVKLPISRSAVIKEVSRTINYNILRSFGVSPTEARQFRNRSIINILSMTTDLKDAYTRMANAKGTDAESMQASFAKGKWSVEEILKYSDKYGSEEYIPRIIKR